MTFGRPVAAGAAASLSLRSLRDAGLALAVLTGAFIALQLLGASPAFAQADPFAWFEQLFKPPAANRAVKPKSEFHRAAPSHHLQRSRPAFRSGERSFERAPGSRTLERTHKRLVEKPAEKPPEKPAVPPTYFVAVIGDSLAELLGQGLGVALADRPEVGILQKAKENSGLVRDDFYDWTKATHDLLASGEKIDFAVMMIGSNDRQSLRNANGSFEPRSPEWEEAYAHRIEAIASQFRERKIPLVWVGLPALKSERLSEDAIALNEFFREYAVKNGAIYVDAWEPFVDELEQYSAFGPDIDGQIVRLRTADGVHFTKAGARKLAHFVEPEIRRRLDELHPPANPDDANAPAAVETGQPPLTEGPPAPQEASLPPADEPAPLPPKPAAGPVLPLTGPVLAPRGELATRMIQTKPAAANRPQTLVKNAPSEPKPGRADDFSWPRP
ncbi:DUF459 domain-containing protein [Methylocapsa palsarum]|uniref:SGNH/GDSL hydrolase family protein n=1 Tax=Methylocapsa palsarum TaxID=1612308 RepID=UPI001587BC1C|nr:SGNH family hydrolase [Methylocapsa palsarum]